MLYTLLVFVEPVFPTVSFAYALTYEVHVEPAVQETVKDVEYVSEGVQLLVPMQYVVVPQPLLASAHVSVIPVTSVLLHAAPLGENETDDPIVSHVFVI
jgi:hypothetical protein